MAGFRKQRVSDLLLGFLAEELRKMSDPRLEFVTLTGAEVTKDLKYAKVYWSVAPRPAADRPLPTGAEGSALAPNEEEQQEIQQALSKASGYLKRRIGEELEIRQIPNLAFVFDKSVVTGARIDELLAGLK